MSDQARIVAQLQTIQVRYPRLAISNATLNAYAEDLAHLEEHLLAGVLRQLGRTSRFFPTIAEILEAAGETTLSLPDVSEAWANAHPLVDQARRRVGDSWYWRTTDETTLRRQLAKAYTDLRADAIRGFQLKGAA